MTADGALGAVVVHKRIETVADFAIPCDRGQRLAPFDWTDQWDEVTCADCLATTVTSGDSGAST